jgi:magnesium transporter
MMRTVLLSGGAVVKEEVDRERIPDIVEDGDLLLWVDITDPDENDFDLLINDFKFHPLAVEDCIFPVISAKIDDYGDYVFITMQVLSTYEKEEKRPRTSQINIFVGKSYVVTVHENPIPQIDMVMGMYRRGQRAAPISPDALLHNIVDAVVDSHFRLMDYIGEKIDDAESSVLSGTERYEEAIHHILDLKEFILNTSRVVSSHRSVIGLLARGAYPLATRDAVMYFRDVYDDMVKIYSLLESYREVLGSITESYLTLISNRLNEIMKVLTIVATIMMPLTFITSIYGMNFRYIPELGWKYGYFVVWGVMIAIAISMFIWFKRKKWI